MFLLKIPILGLVTGFDKPDRVKSQKTIVGFVNRKNCKKALFNKKNLAIFDCIKHSFA